MIFHSECFRITFTLVNDVEYNQKDKYNTHKALSFKQILRGKIDLHWQVKMNFDNHTVFLVKSQDLFLQKRPKQYIIICIALFLDVQNLFRTLIFHLLHKSNNFLM